MNIELKSIGAISTKNGFTVTLEKQYTQGLTGLQGFSHVMIVWYAHRVPQWDGQYLVAPKPYRLAPDTLGIFATRSPYRPNNICVSVAAVSSLDTESGTVKLYWTDAEDGSPVLDLKPYHPSSDRVRDTGLPDWCRHWPAYFEDGGDFAWDKEFLF